MAADQIETLKGLLERVRRAETWDRHIDAALEDELGEASEHPGEHLLSGMNGGREKWLRTVAPYYTKSIDAALALMTRVLPGAMWATGCMEGGPFCRLVYPTGVNNGWGHTVSMEAEGGPATEPLAILSALLSAKLALLTQEESNA